jgi:hypothetical protein
VTTGIWIALQLLNTYSKLQNVLLVQSRKYTWNVSPATFIFSESAYIKLIDLLTSQSRENVLKTSLAISRVNVELKINVSEISSVLIIRVDPDHGDRDDLWNVGFWSTLTRLIVGEDFSKFIRRESFKSYIILEKKSLGRNEFDENGSTQRNPNVCIRTCYTSSGRRWDTSLQESSVDTFNAASSTAASWKTAFQLFDDHISSKNY